MPKIALSALAFIVAAFVTIPAITGPAAPVANATSLAYTGGVVRTAAEIHAQRAHTPPAPRATAPGASTVSVTIPKCFSALDGAVENVPPTTSPLGVGGTTSADLDSFARAFNAIRVANCLPPIELERFHFDACMQARLFWMAEDPSDDPHSAWGHLGSQRSDGVPSTGCDGNLAGGQDNTGATVAQKWWDSLPHRAALYRPDQAIGGVCIDFAMTHGGVPNESPDFTRAAARWTQC